MGPPLTPYLDMKSRPFCVTLTILLGLLFAAPAPAQVQSMPITDSKRLMLNKVWTRLADVYGEEGSVESVEFSPDSSKLVSGTKFDNSVIVWRTSDGTELWRRYVAQEVERVAWSRDGKIVVACSEDYKLTFFDAATGEVRKEIEEDAGIDGLAFSKDGRFLVSGAEKSEDANGNQHGWVRVYAMPDARLIEKLDFGTTVNEIDFSHDGAYLMAVGHNEQVRVWRTDDWSHVRDFHGKQADDHHFISGRFNPDGSMLVAGSQTGDIYLFDFETGRILANFDRSGHKIEVVVFTPDGRYIVSAGNDPFIRFFRVSDILSDNRMYTALQIHAGDQAEYLDFNSRGSLMSSAHQDGTIHLWVVMSEDVDVNARRHEWVKRNQRDSSGNP